jgi:hypothetical protein
VTITPAKRRMKRRIESLPTAHNCQQKGVWVRRPSIGKVKAGLVCIVCGKP